MLIMRQKNKIGVVISGYQVSELDNWHTDILGYSHENNDYTLVLVGSSPSQVFSYQNPLNFIQRFKLIRKSYNDCVILPLADYESNEDWSFSIDLKISECFGSDIDVTLYCRTKKCVDAYSGEHKVVCNKGINNYPSVVIVSVIVDGDDYRMLLGSEYDDNKMETLLHFQKDVLGIDDKTPKDIIDNNFTKITDKKCGNAIESLGHFYNKDNLTLYLIYGLKEYYLPKVLEDDNQLGNYVFLPLSMELKDRLSGDDIVILERVYDYFINKAN